MGHFDILGYIHIVLLVLYATTNAHPKPNSIPVDHPGNVSEDGKKFEDANFWRTSAQDALREKVKERNKIGKAKNIIMFLGDGWDVQTTTAARILKGQQVDKVTFGEEAKLYLETFPSTGFSKTYCVDFQVADSACSATAYLGGVKARLGTIGVTPNVVYGNCTAQSIPANQVTSLLAWAQAAGKSTGLVTTTRITDASPAGAFGHVASRDWECDADVLLTGDDPASCEDLAEQLILSKPGKNIDVILGGGRQKFLPENVKDSEGFPGQRKDGVNLINTWKSLKTANGTNYLNASYVENFEDLAKVDASKTDALLGLFSADKIAYYHDQHKNGDPTLTEMTQKAIEILSKNPYGFFLFVEGGRIDHGHHDNTALIALWETIEFDRAIQKGDEMTDDDSTLIVVTADHGHSMTFSGYPDRGTPIYGIAGMGLDNLPYSTLNYANGPGWKIFTNEKRHNISQDDLSNLDNKQVPLVPLEIETHGGQDIQILAKGPFSHLFSGVHEQNYIPYTMAYAACVGEGPTFCRDPGYASAEAHAGSAVSDWHID